MLRTRIKAQTDEAIAPNIKEGRANQTHSCHHPPVPADSTIGGEPTRQPLNVTELQRTPTLNCSLNLFLLRLNFLITHIARLDYTHTHGSFVCFQARLLLIGHQRTSHDFPVISPLCPQIAHPLGDRPSSLRRSSECNLYSQQLIQLRLQTSQANHCKTQNKRATNIFVYFGTIRGSQNELPPSSYRDRCKSPI